MYDTKEFRAKTEAEIKASSAWTAIAATEDRAVMALDTFHELLNYSASLPTGTYIGKRWRALYGAGWFMGEYVGYIGDDVIIKWREIWITRKEDSAVRATENQIKSFDSQKRLVGEAAH